MAEFSPQQRFHYGENEFPEAYPFYERLRRGASVLATCIQDGEEKILLGRRLKPGNRGKWILPGGGIDGDESAESAATREVLEEANVNITEPNLFTWMVFSDEHSDGSNGQDRVVYWLTAEIKDPENIKGGSDLGEPRLFSRSELVELDDISDVVRPVLISAGWLPVDEQYARSVTGTETGQYLDAYK